MKHSHSSRRRALHEGSWEAWEWKKCHVERKKVPFMISWGVCTFELAASGGSEGRHEFLCILATNCTYMYRTCTSFPRGRNLMFPRVIGSPGGSSGNFIYSARRRRWATTTCSVQYKPEQELQVNETPYRVRCACSYSNPQPRTRSSISPFPGPQTL